jgi:hypothetical protein
MSFFPHAFFFVYLVPMIHPTIQFLLLFWISRNTSLCLSPVTTVLTIFAGPLSLHHKHLLGNHWWPFFRSYFSWPF